MGSPGNFCTNVPQQYIDGKKLTVLIHTGTKPDPTLTISWEETRIPKFLERNRPYSFRVTASSDREMPRVPFGPNWVLIPDMPRVVLFSAGLYESGLWSFEVKGASAGKRNDEGPLVLTEKPHQHQSLSRRFELEFSFIGEVCKGDDCSHILALDCLGLGQIRWVFKPEKKKAQ